MKTFGCLFPQPELLSPLAADVTGSPLYQGNGYLPEFDRELMMFGVCGLDRPNTMAQGSMRLVDAGRLCFPSALLWLPA